MANKQCITDATIEALKMTIDPTDVLTGRTVMHAIRNIACARKYVGVAITCSPENDALDTSDWGEPLVNARVVLYAKMFPQPNRTISVANVWSGWLVAFKARTHDAQPFSYSLACFVPWNLLNSNQVPAPLRNERLKCGLEPIHTLPCTVVPCYACRTVVLTPQEALLMRDQRETNNDAADAADGEPFMKVNGSDGVDAGVATDMCKHPFMECLPAYTNRQMTVDVTKMVGGKSTKRDRSKFSSIKIPSTTEYAWQCAAHGHSVESLQEHVDGSLSSSKLSLPSKASDVEVAVRAHVVEQYKIAATQLFSCEDAQDLDAQMWACRAAKSMCHAQLCFLRNVPVIRECLPHSLRERSQMPLMMAICVHVALNHELFGLQMSVSQHHTAPLRRELLTRVNSINANREFALDALIARAIRHSIDSGNDNEYAPRGLDAHGKLSIPTVRLLWNDLKLPKHTMHHLRECASIGHNIINTFYAARCRMDVKSHNIRSYFHGLSLTDENHPSSAFDEVHAHVAEKMRDAHSSAHQKPALIAPWPVALVPESSYHRLIVCDTLQPAHDFALNVLQDDWTRWKDVVTGTNGLNMFLHVLQFGWTSLRLCDARAFLLSDDLESVCVSCTRSVHSTELAFPFEVAHCHQCFSRMCFECLCSSHELATEGFVCRRCAIASDILKAHSRNADGPRTSR